MAGARYRLRGSTIRVGRGAENDIVLDESPLVSGRHLEIHIDADKYYLYDLNSTNGTFLNGERINEAPLLGSCSIQLGAGGPLLEFTLEPASDLSQTLIAQPRSPAAELPSQEAAKERPDDRISTQDEALLSSAVARARLARGKGHRDQTANLMREVLNAALGRSRKKFGAVIGALVAVICLVGGLSLWKIQQLKAEKRGIDARIQEIEKRLQSSGLNPAEEDQLIDTLDSYQGEALALENNVLYRVGVRGDEGLVLHEIRSLMAEFGSETYSVPPEFLAEVKLYIQRYQGSDRAPMERALNEARPQMQTMRQIFTESKLPPDLSYMVLVESADGKGSASPAGAVGLWQFTPATGKAYGLRVTRERDERLDAGKETRAACKYIRELILEFGSGSSVMLALAAYNLGPTRVRQAVRQVSDPIKQRSFWYLYRVRALPSETREYVPRVLAAMIIARNPEEFGF